MEITIRIDELNNKLKSKFFIVILSNEENLKKCIENNIAGFPETDNGIWAYLDINEGDYVSFYYNGRIFNLYKVEKKLIPEYYKKSNNSIGNERYDPVPLNNGDKWRAISTKKGNIYFPYRLSLKLLEKTDFLTSLVFKSGFERFGINLIPRVSLKKSHFQLSLSDINKIFGIKNLGVNLSSFTLKDFVEVFSKNKDINKEKFSVENIVDKEIFLQTLIKRILEASIYKYKEVIFDKISFDKDSFEFFSEQTVYGGEADIVIANNSENIAFVEVKNGIILKKDGEFTRIGSEAYNQVKSYQDIINLNKKIRKIIAGKKDFGSRDVLLKIFEKKPENIIVIEVNSRFEILSL
ncbi:hypothetical protein HNP65_001104 [Thermosipho japonicus]|uniref:DUF91 domain-containing protein n=1 Tax=Thermosipho japonicus TaxID=90323 RepID=A0A841GG89_9BACT|nr:hypothetical protein [Thermosipho japonicus]MBB6062666.1 hypothetical protein [Thermosipho japonicus]